MSFRGAQRRGIFPGSSLAQVNPSWILRLDQSQLLGSSPTFDLLLTLDRRPDVWGRLVVNELMDVVLPCETRDHLASMLEDPPPQVVGHADVERSRGIGQDVHVERASQLLSKILLSREKPERTPLPVIPRSVSDEESSPVVLPTRADPSLRSG